MQNLWVSKIQIELIAKENISVYYRKMYFILSGITLYIYVADGMLSPHSAF